MNGIENFKEKYPKQTLEIMGKPFSFRYYKNPHSDVTLVLLVGGLGLSDLLAKHFEAFSQRYSVISFDYPADYPNIQSLTDAIAALMRELGIRAYFVGQSLGGFMAQIIAKNHPEVVEGLVLSNTGTLSSELNKEGAQCFYDMLKRIDKSFFIMKFLPFGFVKKQMKKAVLSKTSTQLSEAEKEIMADLCDEMVVSLTKKYQIHMSLLLKDLQNHWNMERADFVHLKGKILLILSDDDDTFNESVKDTLISIMPEPVVVTDILGGHLALMLKFDRYLQTIVQFIEA